MNSSNSFNSSSFYSASDSLPKDRTRSEPKLTCLPFSSEKAPQKAELPAPGQPAAEPVDQEGLDKKVKENAINVAKKLYWAKIIGALASATALGVAIAITAATGGAAAPLVVFTALAFGLSCADLYNASKNLSAVQKGEDNKKPSMPGDALGTLIHDILYKLRLKALQREQILTKDKLDLEWKNFHNSPEWQKWQDKEEEEVRAEWTKIFNAQWDKRLENKAKDYAVNGAFYASATIRAGLAVATITCAVVDPNSAAGVLKQLLTIIAATVNPTELVLERIHRIFEAKASKALNEAKDLHVALERDRLRKENERLTKQLKNVQPQLARLDIEIQNLLALAEARRQKLDLPQIKREISTVSDSESNYHSFSPEKAPEKAELPAPGQPAAGPAHQDGLDKKVKENAVKVAKKLYWAKIIGALASATALGVAIAITAATGGAAAPLVVFTALAFGLSCADLYNASKNLSAVQKGEDNKKPSMPGDALGTLIHDILYKWRLKALQREQILTEKKLDLEWNSCRNSPEWQGKDEEEARAEWTNIFKVQWEKRLKNKAKDYAVNGAFYASATIRAGLAVATITCAVVDPNSATGVLKQVLTIIAATVTPTELVLERIHRIFEAKASKALNEAKELRATLETDWLRMENKKLVDMLKNVQAQIAEKMQKIEDLRAARPRRDSWAHPVRIACPPDLA